MTSFPIFQKKLGSGRLGRTARRGARRLLGVLRVKSHAHWMVVQVVKGMRDTRRAGDGKQI